MVTAEAEDRIMVGALIQQFTTTAKPLRHHNSSFSNH
jgi:hypothetical protein